MADKTLPSPKDRNLFFCKYVDQESIEKLTKEIIEINDDDEHLKKLYKIQDIVYSPKPIKIHIDSFGGNVYQCFGLLSIMENSMTPIHTIVTGCAMSCGFLILICGHKRFGFPLSTTLYHQVSCDSVGTIKKMEDKLVEERRLQDKMEEITLKKTKITKEKLEEIYKTQKDWYLSAEESKELGVIDEIITSKI